MIIERIEWIASTILLVLLFLLLPGQGFVIPNRNGWLSVSSSSSSSSTMSSSPFRTTTFPDQITTTTTTTTSSTGRMIRGRRPTWMVVLTAKKKDAKLAALEALEALEQQQQQQPQPQNLWDDTEDDPPLSKKEQLERLKKQQKGKKANGNVVAVVVPAASDSSKGVNGNTSHNNNNNNNNNSKPKDGKAAALEDEEEMMDQKLRSKKELKEMMKKQPKRSSDTDDGDNDSTIHAKTQAVNGSKKSMSKKEEMLMKALEMEEQDVARAAASADDNDDDTPQLSKKELKELKKKQEKEAAKAAAKAEKKAKKAAEKDADDNDDEVETFANGKAATASPVNGDVVDGNVDEDVEQTGPTLEEKIRKERPPPRIRVMESAQPGYTSLRLENIGITFRNQEVLKDVTWGVQTGDRIGLVGANGAGKTTQLRILAGEMEPTVGDVVKSSQKLRVAMLRQEFIDELVKERTLKEEFMSVFADENKILQDLRDAEAALSNMGEDDTDAMQEILDRMQELQQKADDKEVYALESKVKKIMDLMGFNDDEGDDLVASFSGGWKMRIGLGKVLLKDPNVLLLGM